MNTQLVIIGGGIVGLATAYRYAQKDPNAKIVVLEKESRLAAHQTGRNSGVLHSGIYYKPGSLRASNCRSGKAAMEQFCREEGIPFELCGKVIVAVSDDQRPALQRIFERGQANGVNCRLISKEELLDIEPHCAGIEAIHVPESGIVDYRAVCQRLAEILQRSGHEVRLGCKVLGMRERDSALIIETEQGEIATDFAVNCTGLHSDRTARLNGVEPEARIVPFRGEYFELKPAAHHLCRGLIYPVPDTRFPFLGVHFTKMIEGGVECGPNAVLAFAREGYAKTAVDFKDLWDAVGYEGFRRLAAKYWRTGLAEMWRSASKQAFVESLQVLVPEIQGEHLQPAPSGIRAQAVTPAGELVDDFNFHDTPRMVHVLNAASPAATAALNIGSLIADRVKERHLALA